MNSGLYRGATKAAWGYLFLYLDIYVGGVTVLPAFVGYILFWQALDLLAGEAEGVSVSLKQGPLPEVFFLDGVFFQTVTENLVSNALNRARSMVRVEVGVEGELLLLTVADDGPGFPQPILERGGEPFLRGEGAEDGSHVGMGLYICRLLSE